MQEIYDWDNAIAQRAIYTPHKNEILWYCWFLTYYELKEGVKCDEFKEKVNEEVE